MNGGPSGFSNAPVTRTFVIACALLTIFVGIQSRSSLLGLSYQQEELIQGHLSSFPLSPLNVHTLKDIFRKLQLWRLFERQIGSNKYLVFVLFSLMATSLFEVLALTLLKGDLTSSILASGPYGLIFSSFVPFYFDIPVTTRFHMFGFNFSDKSFIYLAGLQLLLSSWKRSVLPGICGVLAGSLYRLNVFGIRRIKLPQFISTFFSRLFRPSAGGSSSTTSSRNSLGNVPSYIGHRPGVNYASTTSVVSMAEPPEDSIAMLVSMGFNRNSARQALMQARNDINLATNILLETQSH